MKPWLVFGIGLTIGCSSVGQDGGKNSAAATVYEGKDLTEPCSGTPEITLRDVGCDERGYVLYAETNGWVGRARLNIWQVLEGRRDQGWNEEHTLDTVEYDPACGWDHLERTLAQGATEYTYTPDQNTYFICDPDPNPPDNPDDRPSLTYALRLYDQNLNLADCVVWGANIEEVLNDPSGIGVGDVPNVNPVTDSAQITGCRVLLD